MTGYTGTGPSYALVSPTLPALDYSSGNTFLITPSSATFTINITNLPAVKSSVTVNLILDQAAAGTNGYANVIQVAGTNVSSIQILSGPIVTGSATDIQEIVLYSSNGTVWKALVRYYVFA